MFSILQYYSNEKMCGAKYLISTREEKMYQKLDGKGKLHSEFMCVIVVQYELSAIHTGII